MEVARGRGLVGLLDVDADEPPAHDQVVGPLHAAGAGEALGEHPAARQIEHEAGGGRLGKAQVLGAVLSTWTNVAFSALKFFTSDHL